MIRLGWIVDGPLEQRSGGYLYDSIVVDRLRRSGFQVKVFALPMRPYLRRLARGMPPSLTARILDADVDLLVEDELSHPVLIGLNRRLARSRPDLPRLSLVHHLRSSEPGPWPGRALVHWVETRYLRSVSGFIFNSLTTRDSVLRLRPDPAPHIVAVPGADRLGPQPLDPARHLRPGPLRLVFVGNLIPRKRLPLLIEALALLPPGSAQLTVVGDDAADPEHTRRVRRLSRRSRRDDHVHFRGYLTGAELGAELTAAHLLVVPSSYEGYGMAYLEGMGFGLPAVAGRDGGAAEFIRDGVNGFRVDPDDSPALAALLLELHRDRERLGRMARNAYETHRRHPTWSQTGDAVARFLAGQRVVLSS